MNSGFFLGFSDSVRETWYSSDCRALKIIKNNSKLEAIPWELNVENHLFNFFVGVNKAIACDKLLAMDQKMCIKISSWRAMEEKWF